MTDATTAVPKKRRGWLRVSGWIVAVLVVLVIVLYFVGTSSAFFKGVILPRVGQSMHAKITVADAALHPFSGVDMRGLKVETTGTQPLVAANEVRVRYHLFDIMRGNFRVDEVTLDSPTIQIVKNADGTSNLDPLMKSKSAPRQPLKPGPAPSTPSAPPKLDITKIALNDGTIRTIEMKANGEQDTTELSNVNVELDNIRNGQPGKLTLDAKLKMDNRGPAPGASGLLNAIAGGAFTLTPAADLKSATVNGSGHFNAQSASGAFTEITGFAANLDLDVTPTEIKQATLNFQKLGENLGVIRASGPFDAAKQEGHITVEVSGIDNRLLGMFAAKSGMDFGSTTVNSTNRIDMSNQGSNIRASGQLVCANLIMRTTNGATPTLDFRTDYDVNVNRADNSTLLRTLTVDCTQNRQPFLHGELTKPMTLSQTGAANVGDATFKLTLTRMKLADWKAIISSPLSNDVIYLTAIVGSQQGGQKLVVDLNTTIDDANGQRVLDASGDVQYALNAHMADIQQLRLDLPPTARATNQLTLSGQVDMSQPGALQGNLKLAADSLDLTTLYDQLTNKAPPKATGQQPAQPAPAPSPSPANAEPGPTRLPVQSLVLDANIGTLYLREVTVTNWQTKVKIDESHVTVNPCQLTLNGAPMNATVALNLGVPGYQYDINFSADKVPLAPLANSFSEAEKGKASGDLIASAQIKGAGTTGASLKKSLTGDIDFAFTNANIILTGSKLKVIVEGLALALRIPDLKQSPINWMAVDLKAGDGAIQITRLKAVSPMFSASAQGTISIADVLTNSPINNLPLDIALPVGVAKAARLAPPDLATNASDVDLGPIYHVGGTVGNPKPKADVQAIAMITAKALPLGKEAEKYLNKVPNLGGVFGQGAGGTNQSGTNSVGSKIGSFLQALGGSRNNSQPNTNAPSTNQPSKPGIFDLLPK